MANKNYTSKGSSKKPVPRRRGKGKKVMEKNNWQDDAMVKEYDKGRRSAVPIETGSSDNDPQWYVPSGQLIKDVASFPTAIPNGAPFFRGKSRKGDIDFAPTVYSQSQYCPGIMTYNVVPAFGESYDSISPISIAANALFTAVRQATSGTSYYETPDLMLAVCALSSAFSFYSWLCRIYGVMNTYSVYDRYLPKALVTAMGVDFDDILENKADFREFINTYAYKLASFAIPKDVTYITRQIFLYEGIYKDADGRKAQYYMYNPWGFYIWNPTTTSGVGELTLKKLEPEVSSTNGLTFAELSTYADDLLRPLLNSQDFRYVQADFLKAFGEQGMFKVAPISETFTVAPEYSSEVLMQFENAYIYIEPDSITATLTQNPGIGGYFTTSYSLDYLGNGPSEIAALVKLTQNGVDPLGVLKNDKILLNFHKDDVTPEDIMVASRLSSAGPSTFTSDGVGGNFHYTPSNVASEFIAGAKIWYYEFENDTTDKAVLTSFDFNHYNLALMYKQNDSTGPQYDVAAVGRMFLLQSLISAFDWHPHVAYTIGKISSSINDSYGSIAQSPLVFDLDTYCILDEKELQSVNTVAMLGLMSCKLAGSFGPNISL